MVKYVPDRTGRFSQRPHYEPKELDRECENIIAGFLKERHGAAKYPVSTDDLTVLIERDTESLDQFADLSSYGCNVEGLTHFQPGRKPRVRISACLAGDENRQNRLRTTLAHEYGHVRLHAYLWDLEPPGPDLLKSNPNASMQICYRDNRPARASSRAASRCETTVAAMGLIPLGGCAIVDQYGSRAIEYNDQAAASKSSTILLNIMRAAYREPLQFTDLSTVTGLASAQGSLNASIPARIGGHFTTADLLTINPGALISGGPQFNIANLNSQEFYQGLQGPVPAQVIALYAQAGVPLRVLLPLFVSEIEIDDAKANKKWVIHGSGPLTQITYGEFLSALDLLLTEGLCIGGNLYSVPDTARRRVLDVHVFADEIRIFEAGALIASHAPLEGRDQRRLDPAHRKPLPPPRRRSTDGEPTVIRRAGDRVARRSLDFYEAVGRRLAGRGRTR